MNIYMVLELIGGLVFFMFGMNVMSGSLEKMAGGKLEHFLKKMTKNPLISIFLGAVITIAMQSSSATTVMLVGLVNSGIMQFGQTIFVIFGANIGTTLTAWILALDGIQASNLAIAMLKPENFSPILALIGTVIIMTSKNDRKKSIATVLVGFAVLMNGMEMMKDAVSPLAELPEFKELLVQFQNPLLGVLIGTLFTAVIQSSAASIGILQALAATGIISYGMAIPIIMGQNIGTCATSLISCIGTNTKAKRVAVVHVSIKIIGTVVWLTAFCLCSSLLDWTFVDRPVSLFAVALIHTIFNIATTVLLLPFTKLLVRMTEWLVKDSAKGESEVEKDLHWLDERILSTPSIAVTECNSITNKMAEIACQNMFRAMGLFDKYDQKNVDKVYEVESELDEYEDRLGTYLVQMSSMSLSNADSLVISKMLQTIGDFERLGDHAVNLCRAATEIHDKNLKFSAVAAEELRVLTAAIDEIMTLTTEAYQHDDVDLATKVEPLEQVIDKLAQAIKNNHVDRLKKGECTIEMGFILSDILNDYKRISDHCSNIAVAVIEVGKGSFDTHEYLNGVRYGSQEFSSIYEAFDRKYYLAE